MYTARIGLVVSAVATVVFSHMAIISPCPRYSPQGQNCPALPAGQQLDYSMTSPLGVDEPLCKHTVPFPTPSASWTAGQSITVTFASGGAPHGGGHCEFSLSYDGGKTFVVVHQELRHCFGPDQNTRQYTFDLPTGLPSSNTAVFAWTWVNAIGNREFYMNCADVVIKGGSAPYTGNQMTIANHNGYPSIPEFMGNYDTGLQYYNKNTITVSGDGSTVSNPGTNEQQQPPPPPPPPPVTDPTNIQPGNNNTTITTTNGDGGYIVEFLNVDENDTTNNNNTSSVVVDDKPSLRSSCLLGTFRCGTDQSKFDTCDNLGW
ncbi:hypothetical protein GGI21_000753, partial [Coemansia aciculifera]